MQTSFARSFCQTSLRVNFCNFHTVHMPLFELASAFNVKMTKKRLARDTWW